MIQTQDNIIVEAYAPVSSDPITKREEYYATLSAEIQKAQ